jgi:hypothetical protein
MSCQSGDKNLKTGGRTQEREIYARQMLTVLEDSARH